MVDHLLKLPRFIGLSRLRGAYALKAQLLKSQIGDAH